MYPWLFDLRVEDHLNAAPVGSSFTRGTSATYRDHKGVLRDASPGELRVDYDPSSGELLGWLIEEGRTNAWSRSEETGDDTWVKLNALVTSDALTAPDGTETCDLISETSVSGLHGVSRTSPVTPGNAVSVSRWVTYQGRHARMVIYNDEITSDYIKADFDLLRGVACSIKSGGTGSKPWADVEAYPGGLYRIKLSGIPGAASLARCDLYMIPEIGASAVYEGDGVSGIGVWGHQFETGVHRFQPSSYIRTASTSATRSSDVWSWDLTTTDWRADIGTFLVDAKPTVGSDTEGLRRYLAATDGTGSNVIEIGLDEVSSINDFLRSQVITDGTHQSTMILQTPYQRVPGARHSVAITYREGVTMSVMNGKEVKYSYGGSIPDISTIYFGCRNSATHIMGHIQRVAGSTAFIPPEQLLKYTRRA